MSFVQRQISLSIMLAASTAVQPTFAGTNSNTLTVSNRRISCKITQAATPSSALATILIYGLPLSVMTQLATLGLGVTMIPRNVVTVMVSDSNNTQPSTAFIGNILQAWGDFNAAPQVPFHLECQTLGYGAVAPMAPLSYNSASTSAVTVMQNVANQLGCTFENNNITTQLNYPYFYGSPRDVANKCAGAGNFNWAVDALNTLAIWPINGSRTSQTIMPTIAPPPTGQMAGYPTFANGLMIAKTIFDPTLKLGVDVQVTTSIFNNGKTSTWNVRGIDHSLESQLPHGEWFSSVTLFNPNVPQSTLPPVVSG